MITGVDEVGNFGLGSSDLNYFVGVHIDQNQGRLAIKQSQFRLWEDGVPDKHRENGEVKGSLLSDDLLLSFHEQVLASDPKVLVSAVGTIPSQNTKAAVAKHVGNEIDALVRVQQHHNERGNPSAHTYYRMLGWYKNLASRPDMFLKLKCLEELMRISIPYVFGYAQLQCFLDGGDERNLEHLAYKIDKDYIRARDPMIFWREHLRQSLMHTRGPVEVPMLPFWTRDNAPLHRYYPLIGTQGVNLRSLFMDRLAFFDSKDHWEVRMADIFATIVHRVRNRGKLHLLERDLDERLTESKRNIKHIIFGEGQSR